MVYIGIPTRGVLFTETIDSVWANLTGIAKWRFLAITESPVDTARNLLIEKFLESEASHLLMLDDDEVMPAGTLQAMLAIDKPVVVVDAPAKKTGKSNLFKNKDGSIAATGFGCALFKREVFEKIEKPWFNLAPRRELKKLNGDYQFPEVEGGGINENGGEDINFSLKLLQKGYNIVVLDGITCTHLEYEPFANDHRATQTLPITRYTDIID